MKSLLSILAIFIAAYTYGQQDPYYTHFKDVQQAYNPAGAGAHHGDICISGLTHHQWRGYSDQTETRGSDPNPDAIAPEHIAPVTYNLNVGTAFKLNPEGSDLVGVGLTVIDDKIGFTKSTTFMLNLNYKMIFKGGLYELAVGSGIGTTQWGFNKAKFKYRDPNDPNVPTGTLSKPNLDVNFGLMYKQRKLGKFENFYAGMSVTNLNSAHYNIGGKLKRDYVPHYYTIVGADYNTANNIILEPAVLVKYAWIDSEYMPQFDLNLTALYSQSIRAGIGYRQFMTTDAVSLLLGYVNKSFELGYSYDITASDVRKASNGTHEIFVKYCLPLFNNSLTPDKLTPRFL